MISKDELKYFLVELAIYLHLQSPSGLIDAFDMEQLCCLIRKRYHPSDSRRDIRTYAKQLLSSLDFDIGILAERGLQVYSFIHLSFQEYFVSQGLTRKESRSIDEIVENILTFTINPRFRESLRLALGWISWKWPSTDYDQFCQCLISSNQDYAIPVGTLLFFDSFQDLTKLPSKTIIFTALNNLLIHPSWDIRSKYLLKYLSQLSTTMIQSWIKSYLIDDKSILIFCQSFLIYQQKRVFLSEYATKFTPFIYQLLWSRSNRSRFVEFYLDQLFRKLVRSDSFPKQVFNSDLSKYMLSNDPCKSTIHPLIIAVLNAVCGGVNFKLYGGQFHLSFSLKYTHRESSILKPIIDYLDNTQQNHLEKLPILIKNYQDFIDNSSPLDTSIDLIETFIALICLQGLSQISIYEKYGDYQALPLALDRFKAIWFYYNQTCKYIRIDVNWIYNVFFVQNQIQPIMKVFRSGEQIASFSSACAQACKKLRILDVNNLIQFNDSHVIEQYIPHQSEFIYFIDEKRVNYLAKNLSKLNILTTNPFFLLNYLPKSLRRLYSYVILETDSLPLIVLLLECLTNIEYVEDFNSNFYLALIMLQPLLKEYLLENYGIGLIWEKYFDTKLMKSDQTEKFLKAIQNQKLLDQFCLDQVNNLELFIKNEYKNLLNQLEQTENDFKICATLISLARLLQVQYRLKMIDIPSDYCETVYSTISKLQNRILKILVLNFLLTMKNPLFFNPNQTDKLRKDLIDLFDSELPNLSLLTSTLLFIQCKTLINEICPTKFQSISNSIGMKFNDGPNHEQEIAFIALDQCHINELSSYLSDFAKRQSNLPDILHFNSKIFYNFINETNSFESCNTILLSFLYLNELCFDVQYLNLYTKNYSKNDLSSMKDFEELRNQLSQSNQSILTFQMAKLITEYLQILNKNEPRRIIEYLPKCLFIEKNVLGLIEQWINYRQDRSPHIVAQYAALQMIIQGSDIKDLLSIIEDIFQQKNSQRFQSIFERLFNSQSVDSNIFNGILIIFQQNIFYSSKLSFFLNCEKNFQSILNFESRQSKIPVIPILFLIKKCSIDLQVYLYNYLQTFVIKNIDQEKYMAIICKWIIENFIFKDLEKGYEYILLRFIHNEELPQIQKAILLGLNLVFLRIRQKDNYFLHEKVIKQLETMICSWKNCSNDVLAICLLAYGNYLFRLEDFGINRMILQLQVIEDALTNIYEQFFPQTTRIRAKFCLIFMNNPYGYFNKTLDSFHMKWDLTNEQIYKILLNQTLYEIRERSMGLSIKGLVEHLHQSSNTLMDRFILELYNYLCDNNNYLSDQLYDYVVLALKVQEEQGWDKFSKAVKKFGEDKFTKQLNTHYTNYPRDSHYSLLLYIRFGNFTDDLLQMLNKREHDDAFAFLKDIKQISNVDAVTEFINLIDTNMSDDVFKRYLEAVTHLAGLHNVSLFKIHKEISDVLQQHHGLDSSSLYYREQDIFKLLLKISCFDYEKNLNNFEAIDMELDNIYLDSVKIRSNFERIFPTEHKINIDFQREIEYLDRKSVLFFPENPFLTEI